MKLPLLTATFAAAALGMAGCATQSAAGHAAPTLSGPAARVLELPASAGEGQPREVQVLLDEPALKLVTIVLRQGTLLPEHHAPVPVMIQALNGAGTVIASAQRLRIDPTHPVLLAPNVPHAVEPDAGTDLVLLVHHLGRMPKTHP